MAAAIHNLNDMLHAKEGILSLPYELSICIAAI